MVLYHAINMYQLLNCIEHRLWNHKREKASIVIPNFFERNVPYYKKLNAFFDNIYIFNYTKYNQKNAEFVLKYLEDDFDSLFNFNVNELEAVYVGGAQYYFSIYLILKNIKFSIFEDGAGLVSRTELLIETIDRQKVLDMDLLNSFKMDDLTNPYIHKKYCLLRVQEKEFCDERAEDFDVVYIFPKLEKEDQLRIKEFFGCPELINVSNKTVLLLTQNFANLNQMTFEEQIMIYQIINDYFFINYDLLIKPHPSDIMFYEKLFPNAYIIKDKFPSEFLPYIFSELPEAVSTVSSTGINLIEDLFAKKIIFNVKYEKSFRKTHVYYIAIKLLKVLENKSIFFENCEDVIINNLLALDEFISSWSLDGEKCLIVDSLEKNDLDELNIEIYEIIIFLNTDKNYTFINQFSILELLPICVCKEKISLEDNYHEVDEEVFFVYVKNAEEREKVKRFSEEKLLYGCGLKLTVNEMSEKDIYIKALEGQIEALENRLMQYIQKDREEV